MELISREQAIDALREYLIGKRCPDDGTLTCRLIENEVINKLPTIHPQLGTNLAEVGKDCISRQAAIDAICNACGKIDCDKMDKCEKLQLPPANCSEFPNNSDTISRQAVIDAARDWYEGLICGSFKGLEKRLRALPSAEPKKIRGKWIEYEQEFMLEGSLKTVQKTVKECSVCTTKIAGMVGIMNFCPNCGADMRQREVTT